ncbi:hypothetical protein GEMRC1_008604 [Eukaryota sp. GEM-RC1]
MLSKCLKYLICLIFNFIIDSVFDSSDPDLFLYYSWVYSPSPIDFSGKHDPAAIKIDGPEWKTDDIGGYLDIKHFDILHVPISLKNTVGEVLLYLYGYTWKREVVQVLGTVKVLVGFTSQTTVYTGVLLLLMMFFLFSSRVYINRTLVSEPVVPQSPYQCSKGPPPLFPLSEIQPDGNDFQGKMRAVQFYTRTLTEAEIKLLSFDLPQGMFGNGKLSFVGSAASFVAASFYIGLLSLTSSNLQSEGVVFRNLTELELYRNSVMILSEATRILSDSTNSRLTTLYVCILAS